MNSSWSVIKIKDVADVIGGGTPSTKVREYWGGDISWISPKDLTNYKSRYISRGGKSITHLGLEKSSARLLPANSLLFSSRAPIGYLAISSCPLSTNQGFKSLVLKEGNSVEFFYYLLKNNVKKIQNLVTGSTFSEISGSEIKELKFLIPPIYEQKAIAHILGILDNKIELNQKMNQILEKITKILFKSWFVDFDPVKSKVEGRPTGLSREISDLFPDSFEDSELNKIPKGWEIRKFSDFYKIEKGLSYKGKFLTEEGDGMPMINLGCFGGNGVFLKSKIKFYKGDFNKKHVVEAEEIAIANTDITQNRITLGSPIIVEKKGNQYKFLFTHHVFCLRNINNRKDLTIFSYLSLLQPKFRHIAGGYATGTTVLALPKDAIENFQFCLPNKKIIEKFNSLIFPIFEKIRLTRNENDLLTKIRDFLLPKLISGELRIPDAEKIIEEVVN